MFSASQQAQDNVEITERYTQEWIRQRYFQNDQSSQGMDNDIGNYHLIISDEGEGSPLVAISQQLGIKPFVIPSWRASNSPVDIMRWIHHKDETYRFPFRTIAEANKARPDPMQTFYDTHGVYPMLVSVDFRALQGLIEDYGDFRRASSNMRQKIASLTRRHPLFGYLEIDHNIQPDEEDIIRRVENGTFMFLGQDYSSTKGLITKIGTDFALTKQVRAIANIL